MYDCRLYDCDIKNTEQGTTNWDWTQQLDGEQRTVWRGERGRSVFRTSSTASFWRIAGLGSTGSRYMDRHGIRIVISFISTITTVNDHNSVLVGLISNFRLNMLLRSPKGSYFKHTSNPYSKKSTRQPEFGAWAYNLDRGPPLQKVWEKIPDDTDVLITHGPPISEFLSSLLLFIECQSHNILVSLHSSVS